MTSAGFLIYSGIMPLVKTYVAIFFGFLLAKRGLFPAAASRGTSQIAINLSLPCLIFANVVPAFTPANVSAIGPLFLLAHMYLAFGFIFGMIIREVLYVPRNFWQGIIIITGMSNWSNLPNAVVMSVTTQAPFNPATDTTLGVSYVSIFIVAYHITFWVFGAARSLSWDYLPGVPQGLAAERHFAWHEKPIGGWVSRRLLRRQPNIDVAPEVAVKTSISQEDIEKGPAAADDKHSQDTPEEEQPQLDVGIPSPSDGTIAEVSRPHSRTSTHSRHAVHAAMTPGPPRLAEPAPPVRIVFLRRLYESLRPGVNSITVTLIVALVIALVQDLKALFVPVPGAGAPKWAGPDGRPPLAFMIDSASFLGSLAVPLALILLGASFARLRIPRPLRRLPIAAMLAVALAKMVIMPVIGVLVVQAMVHGGMIPKEALAERFVAIFLSGTPTAVNQLIVASLYAPDGEVDTLSAFFLVQYVFMFFTSAALTAVAIALL